MACAWVGALNGMTVVNYKAICPVAMGEGRGAESAQWMPSRLVKGLDGAHGGCFKLTAHVSPIPRRRPALTRHPSTPLLQVSHLVTPIST